MENLDVVIIIAPSQEEANQIVDTLLEEQLVACINVFPAVKSFFRWEGKIQNRQEIFMAAKTSRPNIPSIVEKVKEISSDEVPCVISLPVTAGNPDFLNWVYEETR